MRRDTNFEMDDDSPSNVGGVNASTCQQLADIIGGEVSHCNSCMCCDATKNI